jgi:hypothetical protein
MSNKEVESVALLNTWRDAGIETTEIKPDIESLL